MGKASRIEKVPTFKVIGWGDALVHALNARIKKMARNLEKTRFTAANLQ
jgi:hypothetical protein